MSDWLFNDYLPAFANTVVTELGVAVLFGFWSVRQLGMVLLVNLITHPALHAVLWAVYFWNEAALTLPLMIVLEVVVFLAEGTMLWRWLKLPARRAFMMSAAMNCASYLLGFALER